jgi:predicted nuclease of predicted toxin-antitoxin system
MFDANLSRRLVSHLVDLYPGSEHASVLGPMPEDIEIWDYSKARDLVVVTKDSDFYRMSVTWGPPPKVVWLRLGNSGTVEVAKVLRLRESDLRLFYRDPTAALLILGAP